jgi:homoserine dehydrogenase
VVVDHTSSEDVAALYGAWLTQGVHVVTPNKKANSGDLERFKAFQAGSYARPLFGSTEALSVGQGVHIRVV